MMGSNSVEQKAQPMAVPKVC
jgi:hypothetical protein